MNAVRIQRENFDTNAEIGALKASGRQTGAVVTFTGIVRGGVDRIILEHYPGMAEAEIARCLDEAQKRWPFAGATVVHRFGPLSPGDNIVLVAVAAAHRRTAFEAAEFLMDFLKTRAPFWKQEERNGAAEWVQARDSDEVAVRRWRDD